MYGTACLSVKLFSNCYSVYSFYLFFTKLDTHDVCAKTQKTGVTDFHNFHFLFLGDFLKFLTLDVASDIAFIQLLT